MDLPNLFSATAAAEKFFITLVVTETTVQSALWRVSQENIEITEKSNLHDYQDEESCLVATDESLQELGKDSENVDEVVFGFESEWVDDHGIVDLHKPLLKKVTKQLSLKAVGFVVIDEALFQELKIRDPFLSALVIALTPEHVSVSVVYQGALVVTQRVGRSTDTAADVVEAIARAGKSKTLPAKLPAKMLLQALAVSPSQMHEAQQSLMNFEWTKSHEFLQPPTVDVLPAATILEAVTHQGGRAVAQAQGLIKAGNRAASALSGARAVETGLASATATATADTAEVTPASSATQDFGFEAVAFDDKQTTPEDDNLTAVSATAVPQLGLPQHPQSSFGVPISLTHLPGHAKPISASPFPSALDHDEPEKFETKVSWRHKMRKFIATHRLFMLLGFGSGLLALFLMGWLALVFATQAVVLVTLKTKPVAQDTQITIDPKASQSDPAQHILTGQVMSSAVTGSKSKPTTGVKLVGDKAIGTVTLVNKTESTKVFAAGTKLSSGKFQFSLDKEVTVASASVSSRGSDGETKTYGKTDGAVTAVAIGAESNLDKDVELKVADFANNTYSAMTKTALSGGASREARAVAEKDRETILAELKKELSTQATDALKTQLESGKYVVPTGKITVKDSKYSAKTGDEAESLTLDLNVEVEALNYSIQDLQALAEQVLASQVPAGHHLSAGIPQILSEPATGTASSSSKVVLQVNMSSVAEPEVDTEAWKKELAGVSVATAQNQLSSKTEIKEVKIQLKPGIGQRLWAYIPRDLQRIVIKIQAP